MKLIYTSRKGPWVYLEENRQDTIRAYVMNNIRHHFIPLSYFESVLSLKGPDTHNDYQLKTGSFLESLCSRENKWHNLVLPMGMIIVRFSFGEK